MHFLFKHWQWQIQVGIVVFWLLDLVIAIKTNEYKIVKITNAEKDDFLKEYNAYINDNDYDDIDDDNNGITEIEVEGRH